MEKILNQIKSLSESKNPIFIAIDGMPGSGKSTFAKYLISNLSSVSLIEMDQFFNHEINKNDYMRMRDEVLLRLKKGLPSTYKIYNWHKNKIEEVSLESTGIILIEGICSMKKELIDLYDFKIWIECPAEIGLQRVLKRDGHKLMNVWIEKWIPDTIKFIEEEAPYKKADSIIDYKLIKQSS